MFTWFVYCVSLNCAFSLRPTLYQLKGTMFNPGVNVQSGAALNFVSDGVLEQQLKNRDVSVKDFPSKKWGHSVRRQQWEQGKLWEITNLDTFLT